MTGQVQDDSWGQVKYLLGSGIHLMYKQPFILTSQWVKIHVTLKGNYIGQSGMQSRNVILKTVEYALHWDLMRKKQKELVNKLSLDIHTDLQNAIQLE